MPLGLSGCPAAATVRVLFLTEVTTAWSVLAVASDIIIIHQRSSRTRTCKVAARPPGPWERPLNSLAHGPLPAQPYPWQPKPVPATVHDGATSRRLPTSTALRMSGQVRDMDIN